MQAQQRGCRYHMSIFTFYKNFLKGISIHSEYSVGFNIYRTWKSWATGLLKNNFGQRSADYLHQSPFVLPYLHLLSVQVIPLGGIRKAITWPTLTVAMIWLTLLMIWLISFTLPNSLISYRCFKQCKTGIYFRCLEIGFRLSHLCISSLQVSFGCFQLHGRHHTSANKVISFPLLRSVR